jgi:Flp pilus assembly protein TadG
MPRRAGQRGERRIRAGSKSGQALIETTLIFALCCLVLFGVVQVGLLYASQHVLDHAAVCVARARSVGFNDFMCYKVGRVATIPNAGRITEPAFPTSTADPAFWGSATPSEAWEMGLRSWPRSPQVDTELSRVPLYLGADYYSELQAILDYAEWDSVRAPLLNDGADTSVRARTRQETPLKMPFHRAYYAGDSVDMTGDMTMDNHYPLYLE